MSLETNNQVIMNKRKTKQSKIHISKHFDYGIDVVYINSINIFLTINPFIKPEFRLKCIMIELSLNSKELYQIGKNAYFLILTPLRQTLSCNSS